MAIINFSLLLILLLGVQSSTSETFHRQKRNWIVASFFFDEDYDGPFPFNLGRVTVDESLSFFEIHGQGVDEEPLNVIEINKHTGDMHVLGPIDCEKYSMLRLTFFACNKNTNKTETQLGIVIDIFDANDNPPIFEHGTYETMITESTSQGTELITVKATDHDRTKTNNEFHFTIHSVTPEPHDLEFFIYKEPSTGNGAISFKGCLDYEKAQKYTLTVNAIDHGIPEQLSSSCTVIIHIEDGNNHIPVFTKQTGLKSVKEGEENVLVSHLQVTDKDTRGTGAWKAKYQIQGDKNNNFRITTDPETNDGLLYVEKHLDFEDDPVRNITITVENEIPFSTCKVTRRTAAGLWNVETTSSISATGAQSGDSTNTIHRPSTYQMTVNVEDVDECPVFDPPKKLIYAFENVEVGHHLVTFTAKDPDIARSNTIKYIKGEDPADCVTVDPHTGSITTSKILDRESPFVKDGVYEVTIHAVENGEPPLTGTGTLIVQIRDVNDNAPTLAVSTIDMCQSDGTSQVNITASDTDGEYNAGPFWFRLLGDVEDKWKVEPKYGYSVNLMKENHVYSGHHELQLEVSDLQGNSAVHNLSVSVCRCLNETQPNCRLLRATRATVREGTLGILFICIMLIAGLLLVAFLVSCKPEKLSIPLDNPGHLMMSNTEEPGTDCEAPFELLHSNHEEQIQIAHVVPVTMTPVSSELLNSSIHWESMEMSHVIPVTAKPFITDSNLEAYLNSISYEDTNSGMTPSTASLDQQWRTSQGVQALDARMRNQEKRYKTVAWEDQSQHHHEILLDTVLKIKLSALQAHDKDLTDYEPAVYAEEDMEDEEDLDAISIHELPFDPDLNLDSSFFTLASLCLPGDVTAHCTKP